MRIIFVLSTICIIASCIDKQNDGTEPITSIEFSIVTLGKQSDIPGGQLVEARNEIRFNEILSTIPNMMGEYPSPDFENNQAVFIFSTIGTCSHLEVTNVGEDSYTRIITVTEVYSSRPGLCDPSIESIQYLDFAIVEFERGERFMPVSLKYERRNDY